MNSTDQTQRLDDSRGAIEQGAPVVGMRFVRLPNGMRLSYFERGPSSGPAVVLLHGLSDSCRSFEPLIRQLPPSWRVLAVTMRGHGLSDQPEAGYELADLAQDIDGLLEALRVPAPLIVGHSLGASVARQLVLDRPTRAAGVVYIDAFASYRSNPGIHELASTVAELTDPVDVRFIRAFQESTFARPIPKEMLELVISESQALSARTWRALVDGMLNLDEPTGDVRVHVPTLQFWGTLDAFVPRADQERLLAESASARLIVCEGTGHAPHWEDPPFVARELVAFANTLPRTPRDIGGRDGELSATP